MINHRQIRRDPPGQPAGQFQAFESLRTGDFMEQLPVDVDEAGAIVFLMDDMGIPEFVVERAGVDLAGKHGGGSRLL